MKTKLKREFLQNTGVLIATACEMFSSTPQRGSQNPRKGHTWAQPSDKRYMYMGRGEASAAAQSSLHLRRGGLSIGLAVNLEVIPWSPLSGEPPS